MADRLPVAIIGAGPIGLAAASHLLLRGEAVRVFEAAPHVGASIREWGHVRLFSVWDQCIDEAAATILRSNGWTGPAGSYLPLGRDLVEQYLEPLARTPQLSAVIETTATVIRIARRGLDRLKTTGRDSAPFNITIRNENGSMREVLARAVIDTSGTWQNPNPIGADGWPAEGEEKHGDRIVYGIPDISGAERDNYAGMRTLVMGGGHSAANALLDLALLASAEPVTSMTWAVRGQSLSKVFGGGAGDQLPARGQLGNRLRALVDKGQLNIEMSFAARRLKMNGSGVLVEGLAPAGNRTIGPFDRIIVSTGQRPSYSFARELQLDLHPIVESTRTLGPLIDPNLHSCGTVPPHGWRELAHTEPDYFVAGIKSYGRAPTFLLLTGHEQVRSIAAHLAGDQAAADDVRLVLPETGVCNATLDEVAPGGFCCEGAAPQAAEPCCARPEWSKKVSACCGQAVVSAPAPQKPACESTCC